MWLSCAVSTHVSHSAIITFEISIKVLCASVPARVKDVEECYIYDVVLMFSILLLGLASDSDSRCCSFSEEHLIL